MIPMCIATPSSKHPQLRSPKGRHRLHWPLRGQLCLLDHRPRDVRVSGRTRRTKDFEDMRGTAEPVTRRSGQGHNGDGGTRVRHNDGKVLHLLGDRPRNIDRTPLGQDGYRSAATATHEFAAKAAAVYFAKHRRETVPSVSCAGARSPRNEWRADSELFKRADPPHCIGAASIKSAHASASNLGVAMARWIKCTHQNC